MNNLTGYKKLWGLTIKVLEVVEGPDRWGLIRIHYKVKKGRKIYSLWVYPEDLKEVK